MDFTYNLLKKGLEASQTRQETILHNIANVNTENYRAKKVEFENALRREINRQEELELTHPKHFDINGATTRISEKKVNKVDRNNNDVDLTEEMVDLTTNQLFYNGVVQQINKKIAIRSYVINGGR
jgi:flagellar basal-body rod protein FlgB